MILSTASSCFLSLHSPIIYPRHHNLIVCTLRKFSNSRRAALISSILLFQFSPLSTSFASITPSPSRPLAEFFDIADAGGVKALDIRVGTGDTPVIGDKVAIHYYGRLAAKQGWRFDSTYDHKDETGDPIPFVFVVGSGKFFDRQRLFTTIFNPTRIANGEGSTLGTLVFDIELLSLRSP